MTREFYLKHKDLIEAWANGTEIEYNIGGRWYQDNELVWGEHVEYRIKPVVEFEWWAILYEDGFYNGVYKERPSTERPLLHCKKMVGEDAVFTIITE